MDTAAEAMSDESTSSDNKQNYSNMELVADSIWVPTIV